MDRSTIGPCWLAGIQSKDGDHDRHHCPMCGHTDYHNPKPAASAIVIRDGHVLFSKRGKAPKRGEWDLPGGFVEAWESGKEALARELKEETGMELVRAKVMDILSGDYAGTPTLTLIYRAECQGEPVADDDSEELHWFPFPDMPWPLAWPHEELVLRRVMDQEEAGQGAD